MSYEAVLLLALLAAALVAFVADLLPVEVTALGLLCALVVFGIVPTEHAFHGFGNKAVVAIGGLFVLGQALRRTGLLEGIAERLAARTAGRPWLGVAVLIAVAALLSGILNNTAVVAIFIPLVMDLCRRAGISPSKALIPLSYAVICGGMLSLIGTSTNLLVSALLEETGAAPLGMFEFTQLGAVYLAIGLGYVLVAGPRLLPPRASAGPLTNRYRIGRYLTEVRVERVSALAGSSARDLRLRERYAVTVLAVLRDDERISVDLAGLELRPGDVLMVQGAVEDILRFRNEQRVALIADICLNDQELAADGQLLVEALVSPRSALVGRTLRELDFRRRFGAFVLAIGRHALRLRDKIDRVPLEEMDSLLLLVPRGKLEALRRSDDVLILTEEGLEAHRPRHALFVLGVLLAAVTLAATGVLEIAFGALIGAVVVVAFGALSARDAYRAVDWSVLLLIAAFVPVGEAFASTGAASALAGALLRAIDMFPVEAAPHVAIALLYLATSLLTQVVSNSAAAIIATPIALSSAVALGVDPRALVVAVCFAASADFMTPTGYQTNLMVYTPGAYRFLDYTRFGAPLNLALWIAASLLIPRLWPL